MKKTLLLFITLLACYATAAQRNLEVLTGSEKGLDELLFSKNVRRGEISGFLVGKYGPPDRYKYFKFSGLLDAEVFLLIKKKKYYVDCRIEPVSRDIDTYFIKILLEKDVIDKIRNEQNLEFAFTFYVKGDVDRVVRGGRFRTTSVERKRSNTLPRSSIMYDPGFVVSAPAELSIYLLQEEVNYSLKNRSNTGDPKVISESNVTFPTFGNLDSLKNITFGYNSQISDSSIRKLTRLLNAYSYCVSYLDSNSFLNFEGRELRNDIRELLEVSSYIVKSRRGNQNLRKDLKWITDEKMEKFRAVYGIDSTGDGLLNLSEINSSILLKKDALKVYEQLILDLESTRQALGSVIKNTFYNFDRR